MAADAAVAFLLEKVTGIIVGYADLISGAGKEFKQLQDDVKLLKTNINKLSKDPSVKEIQNQVRDVIYEVEDTIDSWLTQAAALKSKGKVKRLTKWLSPNHISLASQVKTLRQDRVKEMLDKTMTMGSTVGTTNEEEARGANTDQPLRLERVVQLLDAEGIITGSLTKRQNEFDIIPIIGMPGLGKTTMAWRIFNDKKICEAFPIRIWVQFSQRFDSHDVFLKIMDQINQGNNDMSSKTDRELSVIVHSCLVGEKFLLVFDDVWETEHWDVIQKALPYENGRGKVLITSRDMKVGRHVQHNTEPYEQRFLDPDESWKLIQYEVFGELDSCPEQLKDIGKYVAKECNGVPLTILLMGGVLKYHYLDLKKSPIPVIKKWKEMADNVNLALKEKEQAILDVVAMSYNSLPDYLRDCFLYLGVFPEGYEIPSWTLTSLWIAEGFIKPDETKSLEEIATDNMDKLISRNLLMALKINSMKEVKVCGVHDMIRVFCRSEASKQNLFREIKMLEKQVPSDTLVSDMKTIRRLCLHYNLLTFFSTNLGGPRVRSFLSFGKEVTDLEQEHNAAICESFLALRILQSNSIKFKKFPESVTKLAHLRYIVLCVDDLEALPETISQLWNLQTIIIDTKSNSVKMEANIWKMIRLRHVKTKAAIVLGEKCEGAAGENLQILNRLSAESVTTAFSRKATNLKNLGIHGKLAPLFEKVSLQELSNLEKLKLYHAATGNRLQSFPGRDHFPSKLKRLTLSNTSLDWNHMYTLATIGDLEVLKLKNNAFIGMTWKAVNYVFSSLQFLLIVTTDLVFWEASADVFPSLTHLVLKECKNLNKIPDGVLQHLENLEIEHVRKSTADSVRNSSFHFKLSVGSGCDI